MLVCKLKHGEQILLSPADFASFEVGVLGASGLYSSADGFYALGVASVPPTQVADLPSCTLLLVPPQCCLFCSFSGCPRAPEWLRPHCCMAGEGRGGQKAPSTCPSAEVVPFSLSAVSLTSLLQPAMHTPSPPAQPPSTRLLPAPSPM